MKFNNKELINLSCGEGIIEGRLHHKKSNGRYSHAVFKEKWFKLKANILFYFHISETGEIFDKKPSGAYILENFMVKYEMDSEVPFSFSFCFNDEVDKKHLFAGRTQENVNKWVEALKQASYEYWRSQLMLFQEKLKSITGQDPLLMYPRNNGCRQVFLKSDSEKTCNLKNVNSTFYTITETKIDHASKQEIKFKNVQKTKKENFVDALKSVPNPNQAIQIPPIRPARGNKLKQKVNCENLIDL